jgi:hypothetical protein
MSHLGAPERRPSGFLKHYSPGTDLAKAPIRRRKFLDGLIRETACRPRR